MFRLIILLLPITALIIVAVQNRTPAIALNFLGGSLPAMPFGLLLAITTGFGALITLLIYGLISWRRPLESKYKPMGRRVPYPDSDPSPSNPAATPSTYSSTGSSDYATSSYPSDAFVPEPYRSEPPSNANPTPTPQDSPRNNYQNVSRQTSEVGNSPPPSGSTFVDSIKSNLPFTKKKNLDPEGITRDRQQNKTPVDRQHVNERPIGEDWGEKRTVEQINDWEAIKPSVVEEGIDSLFKFGKSAGTNVGRIADDIASGWNTQPEGQRPPASSLESYYAEPYGDELDQGWENFDNGYDDLPPSGSEPSSRRTYGDSLYRSEEPRLAEDDYSIEDDYIDPSTADEIGPNGVYEADYRVIVPPSKPLEDPPSDEPENDRY